ncbi:MAG: peptidase [Thermomicrobiales bacterium]|jgi:putative glutamine amidotransferase|nr:peptidase [Thermomicrobiales bacterium]
MKPVIGITPSPQLDTLAHGTFRRYVLSAPYVRAVEKAGGVALILPPQREAVATLVSLIDGLLLSGGADLDPARYGDGDIHPTTYGIDPERDQFEIDLFDAALRSNIPVLGICRGIQVINVALGGTLIQDVASEHPGATETGHRQHERGLADWQVGHVTTASSDTLPLFTEVTLGVNSFHHQAIRDLAAGLEAVAFSPDGLIEAVVMPDAPDVFAVQWHPELMFEHDEAHLRPFTHLVQAATARRLATATA